MCAVTGKSREAVYKQRQRLRERVRRILEDEAALADGRARGERGGGASKDDDRRIEALARRVREKEAADEPEELFRPLDAEERSALADSVFASLDAGENAEAGAKVVPLPEKVAAPKKNGAQAPRRSRWGLVLLAAALGALAVLFVVRKDAPQPIAAYTLSVEGGNKAVRSDPAAPEAALRLDPTSRLALALRPEKPVSGAIAVRGYLVREGAARFWGAPAAVGAGGVMRIEGTAGALFEGIPEGEWEIVLLLGRPEVFPEDAASPRREPRSRRRISSSENAPREGRRRGRADLDERVRFQCDARARGLDFGRYDHVERRERVGERANLRDRPLTSRGDSLGRVPARIRANRCPNARRPRCASPYARRPLAR